MDLTRFDFNVHNFLNSESVETMTDAEVGQYVLLLSKSWALAKDASLPDNSALLARWAHCDSVSLNVLKKFPQVETADGARRRNGVLFTEWQRAVTRSQQKRDAVNVRWENKRNTPVSQDVLHPVIPKPNQAVPIQTEPIQTESEAVVSKRDRFAQIAGKRKLSANEGKDVDYLIRQYGDGNAQTVIDDFALWFAEAGAGYDYPISGYLKVAQSRLQSGVQSAIIQSDPRINEIVAFVFTVSQQAPRGADVAELLADYSQEEIQDAFKAYTDNLDEFGLKGSARTFFKDGAGAGIILARRQKKAADVALEASTKASIEAGIAGRRLSLEELTKKIADEEKLADQLGDKPF